MSEPWLAPAVQEAFLIFCRVGAALMVAPGLSSVRVPMRVRLLTALSISLALAGGASSGRPAPIVAQPEIVLIETIHGFGIGLAVRLIIEGLEFSVNAIAAYIGLASPGGSGESPADPALGTLAVTAATVILLATEFPSHLLVTFALSLEQVPIGSRPDPAAGLTQVLMVLRQCWLSGLQLSAPYLAFALVTNVLFGVLGRLVPQIPSYFVSGPFIALGGLCYLWLGIGDLLGGFLATFAVPFRN